jgi:hypothetical protein
MGEEEFPAKPQRARRGAKLLWMSEKQGRLSGCGHTLKR